MQDKDDHSWLKQGSTSSSEVEKSYDDWATTYDEDLVDWDYRAPADAARLLSATVPRDGRILDAGCGTGLTGAALKAAGFSGPIDGIDISQTSLQQAEGHGVYRKLQQADMQQLPLDIPDDAYDGLFCIGVLTYVPDTEAVLRDFARVVQKGGTVLISQRNDLFEERNYASVIEALAKAGIFSNVKVTEPQPYLPGNPDFGAEILVIYAALEVA
ncbi:MAG: class I SAM-dependent methyltransferase [Alphaproteobacteria bacterium]|jgi:predicted TPR repeat methyltransferase|nr:class I SAM-dependent methyltransferase [Alphaproteobacteria bacterium]MDP6875774.1 class I SAM-dependent methyltransferase [Alphaproteobacteria bacterium]